MTSITPPGFDKIALLASGNFGSNVASQLISFNPTDYDFWELNAQILTQNGVAGYALLGFRLNALATAIYQHTIENNNGAALSFVAIAAAANQIQCSSLAGSAGFPGTTYVKIRGYDPLWGQPMPLEIDVLAIPTAGTFRRDHITGFVNPSVAVSGVTLLANSERFAAFSKYQVYGFKS